MIQTPRINWIDWAKFFGIFLVVLGHVYITDYPFKVFIYSFHMPLFFALSGLTFRPRRVIDEIKLSAKRLLVPYCVFMAFGYALWLVAAFRPHPEVFEHNLMGGVIKPFLGLVYGVGFDMPFSTIVNVPIWFLVALFCMRVIVSAVHALFQKNALSARKQTIVYALIMLISPIIAYILRCYSIAPPFSLRAVFMTLPFFLGAYLLKDRVMLVTSINGWVRGITCVVLFACLVFLSEVNGRIDVCGSNFGHYPLLFVVNALIGTAAFVIACSFLNSYMPRSISFASRNTLTILGMHGLFKPFVSLFLVRFVLGCTVVGGGEERLEYLHDVCPYDLLLIVMAAIMLFLSLVPCYIFERWFPRLIGK